MLRSTSERISRSPLVVFCRSVVFPWLSEISVWVERNAIEDAPIIRVPVTTPTIISGMVNPRVCALRFVLKVFKAIFSPREVDLCSFQCGMQVFICVNLGVMSAF